MSSTNICVRFRFRRVTIVHMCSPASKILTCQAKSQFRVCTVIQVVRRAHLDIRSQKVRDLG